MALWHYWMVIVLFTNTEMDLVTSNNIPHMYVRKRGSNNDENGKNDDRRSNDNFTLF